MLAKKGLRLDAVVELKVDPDILIRRIESRVEQMKLRGEPLRADDNPEVLKQRLAAYGAQTAPLVDYYRGKGALRTVDGMASIADVAAAIGRALADAAFRPVPARKAAPGTQQGAPAAANPRRRKAGNRPRPAKKPAGQGQSRPKAVQGAPRRRPRPPPRPPAERPARAAKKPEKPSARRRLTK